MLDGGARELGERNSKRGEARCAAKMMKNTPALECGKRVRRIGGEGGLKEPVVQRCDHHESKRHDRKHQSCDNEPRAPAAREERYRARGNTNQSERCLNTARPREPRSELR